MILGHSPAPTLACLARLTHMAQQDVLYILGVEDAHRLWAQPLHERRHTHRGKRGQDGGIDLIVEQNATNQVMCR
jgi:hypothetical protein